MLSLILLTLLVLALSHWLLEPLVATLTPLFHLAWIGWGLLAALLWAFAGRDQQ